MCLRRRFRRERATRPGREAKACLAREPLTRKPEPEKPDMPTTPFPFGRLIIPKFLHTNLPGEVYKTGLGIWKPELNKIPSSAPSKLIYTGNG